MPDPNSWNHNIIIEFRANQNNLSKFVGGGDRTLFKTFRGAESAGRQWCRLITRPSPLAG